MMNKLSTLHPLEKFLQTPKNDRAFSLSFFRYFRACATLGIQTEWQPLEYKDALLSMRVNAQPWKNLHFDLGKTRSATTDYVTCKATVLACNRIVYVAYDWHSLVRQTGDFYSTLLFVQRKDCLALFQRKHFFVQQKVWFFTGAKFLLLGLWTL